MPSNLALSLLPARHVVAAVAPTVALVACGATVVPYLPRHTVTPAEAMRVVERTIEQQPGKLAPYAVEVTPVKLRITSRSTQILYFDDLWRSDLSEKGNYFIVRFWDDKSHGFRIFVSEIGDAKRFLDSLYVLSEEAKLLAKLPDEERGRRIRVLERQRKVLELEFEDESPED